MGLDLRRPGAGLTGQRHHPATRTRPGWSGEEPPYANLLWHVRGLMDRLVGGVGMRLGRRDPDHLRVGDALDFWRVEEVRRPTLLRLRAEMKVPGRAWLPRGTVRVLAERAIHRTSPGRANDAGTSAPGG